MSKPTLSQILADPKNRQVSTRFFKFAFLIFLLPVGFLLLALRSQLLSVQTAGILAVLFVNVIMGIYALGAYREDLADWKEGNAPPEKKRG